MGDDKLGSAHRTQLSVDLPHHLIFDKILLPTKPVVQAFFFCKQYLDQDIVSLPIIDFDEEDDFFRHHIVDEVDCVRQHKRFVKFLEGYLEYHREKNYLFIDKVIINMRMYTSEDATILNKWLEYALDRAVLELDISFPKMEKSGSGPLISDDQPMWCLPWSSISAKAKYLQSLKLERVRFPSFVPLLESKDDLVPPILLPSLKTLSLKALQFGDDHSSFYNILSSCPYIEYLSLIDFDHFQNSTMELPTICIKSLEFRYCEMPQNFGIVTRQADVLESFTFVGVHSDQKPPTAFSWETLLHIAGKSLTYLNLQSVSIVDIPSANNHFPSLKTISFTNIHELDEQDLLSILSECPSLEYLSLTECSFRNFKCRVSNSTLKSLEVKNCSRLRFLQVDDAKNLKSFTFLES